MPPKRPASAAFQAPRSKAPSTGTKSGNTTRPRAKFIPAPAASSSSQAASEDDDEDDEEQEDEEPSEQESPSNSESSSDANSPPPPAARRPVVAARPAPRRRSPEPSPDADENTNVPPVMPEKLLTALLYSHFQQPETKIGREARDLVGKYVETFVREAVARAIVERKGVAGGGDFLEVEDLEKLAPQLILDF